MVAPSTPSDAKGLLKAAIRDPDPVIYFEHKYLYRRIKGAVPDADCIVPIGKAEVKSEGADLSIITYGAMVHQAFEAATRLSREGVSAEILDLRTLLPLDRDAIVATARKTGKVLIVHEATRTGGVGAEVAAVVGRGGLRSPRRADPARDGAGHPGAVFGALGRRVSSQCRSDRCRRSAVGSVLARC